MNPASLWIFCVVMFLDGAIFSPVTTPTLLYFAKYHDPWLMAAAGSASSGLGSAVQYAMLRWVLLARHGWMKRFAPSREKLEAAIGQYPSASFITILVARATPLPDAPAKLVAAFVEYPVRLYFLATLLGAVPYYYVIALVGRRFRFPTWVLVAAILAIWLFVLVDWLRNRRREKA